MAPRKPKFAYEMIEDLIHVEIMGRYRRRLDAIVKSIELRIRQENEKFFKLIANTGMGRFVPPNIIRPYVRGWPPFSRSHHDFKKKMGYSMTFFKMKGDLISRLQKMNARRVLGLPEVVDVPGVRTKGGRVKMRDMILISPFSGIEEDDDEETLASLVGTVAGGKTEAKLTVMDKGSSQIKRPILRPFVDYWIDIRIKQIVAKELR